MVINTPKFGKHWGSESAAPAVKNIFKRIISNSDEFYLKSISKYKKNIDA